MLELLQAPPQVLHTSLQRWEEVSHAQYGDITSTGRELSDGSPADGRQKILEWARSPLPQRTRDYHNNHQNSDKWDLVDLREGDVVISTSYKSGTTWLQTICINILYKGKIPGFDGDSFSGILEMSPWVDLRVPPPPVTQATLAGQSGRRVMKSHLPLDGLPFSPAAKYIAVVRDIRDVTYSWMNHWWAAREFFTNFLNKFPGMIGPGMPRPEGWTHRSCFHDMAMNDCRGLGIWSSWHFIATWLEYRHLPNVLTLHYANLKAQPREEISRIAEFIGVELTPEELDLVVHNTSFAFMKENNAKVLGVGFGSIFEGGGATFLHKGTNGRWEGELTPEDISAYREMGAQRLGEEAMAWLETGQWPPAQN